MCFFGAKVEIIIRPLCNGGLVLLNSRRKLFSLCLMPNLRF